MLGYILGKFTARMCDISQGRPWQWDLLEPLDVWLHLGNLVGVFARTDLAPPTKRRHSQMRDLVMASDWMLNLFFRSKHYLLIQIQSHITVMWCVYVLCLLVNPSADPSNVRSTCKKDICRGLSQTFCESHLSLHSTVKAS